MGGSRDMHQNDNRKLIGDGIQDDGASIQKLLDSGLSTVYLPQPSVNYLISRPLVIHSCQELKLDKYTVIKLAKGSDCVMLTNDSHKDGNEHISVTGGIWDMQNHLQTPNPLAVPPWYFDRSNGAAPVPYSPDHYMGILMRFVNVKHFSLSGTMFRDPVTFCVQLAKISHFTVRDIVFDFKHFNPVPHNMDGIHLDGDCHYGFIQNLQGQTFDDLVALNADDDITESPHMGPIDNIRIDGIYAKDCHSAVRLLSTDSLVGNISISNVYGTYYQYCIGFTNFPDVKKGHFGCISISDIFASKATRYAWYKKDNQMVFPFIWLADGVEVECLDIRGLYREENEVSTATVEIDAGASVKRLSIIDSVFVNKTKTEACLLKNNGSIGSLELFNIDTDQKVLINDGIIDFFKQDRFSSDILETD
jgi:hypothetical protein